MTMTFARFCAAAYRLFVPRSRQRQTDEAAPLTAAGAPTLDAAVQTVAPPALPPAPQTPATAHLWVTTQPDLPARMWVAAQQDSNLCLLFDNERDALLYVGRMLVHYDYDDWSRRTSHQYSDQKWRKCRPNADKMTNEEL
jgi:hypothetical protein